MSGNPSKRPRLGDTNVSDMKDIQDEEIWMQDGNIVVAAVDETKHERRLFKCHRGLLASRLPVLKEMFEADLTSGSVTASASEHYEGTPIVRLYDEPDHVRQLLHVLYNPSKLPYKWWLRRTMEELVGLMRLSQKYEAQDLYNHCVVVFKNAWPATLEEWDHRNHDAMARIKKEPDVIKNPNYELNKNLLQYLLPEPGMAVALADEHHLVDNCATAFYALNKAYRVGFYKTPDGSPACDTFPDRHPASIRSLSPRLLQQFTHGREFIRCIGLMLFSSILPQDVSKFHYTDPADHKRCKKELRSWWQTKFAYASLRQDGLYSSDPLGLADELSKTLDKSQEENEDMCEYCRGQLQRCLLVTRQYIWDKLRLYFLDSPAHPNADLARENLSESLSLYLVGIVPYA